MFELADLLDLRVLLDTPRPVAASRLRDREGDRFHAEWEDRWRMAEEHYFRSAMSSAAFDLVLHA